MDFDFAPIERQARATDDAILLRDARALGLTDWTTRRLRVESRNHNMPRGTLVIPPVRDTFRARARAAQLLVPDAVLCGTTAARLLGLQGLRQARDDEPIELALPPERTRWQRAGLRLRWLAVPEDEVIDADGLRVTAVERTLLQVQRSLETRRFVCLADSAVQQGLLASTRVGELIDELPHRWGRQWQLVDGRSESPSETVVRLVLIDACLTPDELQLRVVANDRVIARLDMGWRRRRVGLEVDSGVHDAPDALYKDRYRQNQLISLG